VRPVKLYPGVDSPLNTVDAGIDMVILRENLEGLFASFGGGCQLNDQPSHGSAPQLAGKNAANPLATILSAAMMLDWLGHRHQDNIAMRAANTIESAVKTNLQDRSVRTADLGGDSSTGEVASAVADAISITQPTSS
jgi:isocitrate/isopropylmalate dehydrogenase